MRIAFLCSCVESGKDGVGDYVRQLSKELRRLGHEAAIVALHDRYVSQVTELNFVGTGDEAPMLRWPGHLPWSNRILKVNEFLTHYDPDLISLQFVPYGFGDKGINWNLGRHLRKIIAGRKTHVMFHEIWIGAHRGASLKDQLIGMIQRRCILGIARGIAPSVVTTTNEAYAALLRESGVSAFVLPLFGNIPVTEGNRSDWLDAEFRRFRVAYDRNTHWIFAFFGTLHPVWEPEPLFTNLAKVTEEAQRKVIIAGIGRLGPGEARWGELSREYGGAFRFVHFGEQSPERISAFLATADFGIAASPWELAGKSGTVASMIEHGLPVIVSRDDIHFDASRRTSPGSRLLIKMDAGLPSRLLSIQRTAPKSILPEITRLMLQQLGDAGTTPNSSVAGCGLLQRHESPD
jgi:glycosyltransferase involved in cell wall biosynthesis